MAEFLYAVLGFIIPFITAYAFSKLNSQKAQELLTVLLKKVLKDEKALNKTTNAVGLGLIDLGISIIENTDPTEGQKEIEFAKELRKFVEENAGKYLDV